MLFHFMDGGQSYNAASVVLHTRTNILWLLFFCTLSFVGAYMQYFGAISMGFKHRTHSIPLLANLWFFAHDTTYLINFHHWFYDIDFWLVKAFWFALAVYACSETVVTYQILRFSRVDLFPGMTTVQAITTYVGLQIFAYGLFWWFLSMITDPYYYLCFSTTVVISPLLNINMMRARGSRKGFSPVMLYGFVLLVIGFWGWMFLSDAYFLQPFFLMVAAGNLGFCIAGIIVYQGMPANGLPKTLPVGVGAISQPVPAS